MSTNALLIGGAGTGKTTRLMETVDKHLAAGIDPYEIGFLSFTTAATGNAISRACDRFDLNPKKLKEDGWFRTLHSLTYRCLGVKSGEILTDDAAKDKEWFSERMGFTPGSAMGSLDKSTQELTLAAWDVCRQRLEPWPVTREKTPFMTSLDHSRDIIQTYETSKHIDGRSDFTDLLGRFAGIAFNTLDSGHGETRAEGWVPHLESLIVDEAQDNSALMDRCLRRIAESTRFAILAGDPFQSVFSFSGSDHSRFTSWQFQKREIMPQSHRCPDSILALGEKCIRNCGDWWDRKIAPANRVGSIKSEYHCSRAVDQIDDASGETWLLLSRTNWHLSKYVRELKSRGIPYLMSDGGSPWNAPVRNAAFYALMMLEQGHTVTSVEWAQILALKDLPVKFGDRQFLERGTKAAWKKRDPEDYDICDLQGLEKWGATDFFKNTIASRKWIEYLPFAREYTEAVNRCGLDAVQNPRVMVSTIHSAKGLEADSVALLDTTSGIVAQAADDPHQKDEEHRLAYVGVTRAKKNLIVVTEPRERFRMQIG